MSEKITVAVLMGGVSTEHEISIKSGLNVCNSLSQSKFNIVPVLITEIGLWIFADVLNENEQATPPESDNPLNAAQALQKFIEFEVDVAFIALHGPGGEDGVIQGFLETAGIPYTGSRVLGNAIGMDKIITKHIVAAEGLLTPKFLKIESRILPENTTVVVEKVNQSFGFPCVAKISNQGSSRNVGIAKDENHLISMLHEFAAAGEELLIEEFIKGREITCAVINKSGETESIALPPTELIPKTSDWFDFEAKYTPGATDEITPADISEELTKEIQRIARQVHAATHCGGMSRTDCILADEKFYVIEINTIPGLTNTSLIPQAAQVAGISMPELLEMQIQYALTKQSLWNPLK